ncbi:MAG TPA: hypothetical protein VH183_01770 [Burkholderiaceae bacterium]|nr:hypothetical protein [Burkholderiaceae bacterium]
MSISVTPSASAVQLINSNQQFKATGTYSDGSSKDLTASVTWSVADPTVIQVVNDPASNGLATPMSPGSTAVTAALGGVAGSTQVTVTTDGLSGWAVRQFSGIGIPMLAYSGSRYVDLAMQMTSTDATTWHPIQGGKSISEQYQYGLVWTGTQFVTWGNVSPDGLHWTPHDLSSISTHASIQRLGWSGTQLVAISGDQRYQITFPLAVSLLFSSPDGVDWTQNLGPYQDPDLSGIAWTGSKFYVVGVGGSVTSSADGSTWTGLTSSGPVGARAIAVSPGRLVAVGGLNASGSAVAPIQASPDGVSWSVVSPPAWTGVYFFTDVVWNGSLFVAVGEGVNFAANSGVVATSPDGLTWTLQSNPPVLNSVLWSGSQFVAAGQSVIQTSPDGTTWTSVTSTTPGADQGLGVIWSGSQFAAVTSAGTIIESPDGIAWTTAYQPTSGNATGSLSCIAWSGTLYAACASSGFLTSPDGATWTFRPSLNAAGVYAVLWAGTQFVAIAGNLVLTSPDGVAWTTRTVPVPASTQFTSVAWSGSTYVVAGTAGLLTSTNAVTWGDTKIPAVWVTWNGKQFVAADGASPSSTYTSADGATWTRHAAPFTLSGGPGFRGLNERASLIWTGSQFLAQGCSSAPAGAQQACNIFTSADGVTWTVSLSMTYPYFQLMAAAAAPARTVMMGSSMILTLP